MIDLNDPVIGGRTAAKEPPPYRFLAVLRHPLPHKPEFAVLVRNCGYNRKVRSRCIQLAADDAPQATVFVRTWAEKRTAMTSGWTKDVTHLWRAEYGAPGDDGLYLWPGAAALHEPAPEPVKPSRETVLLTAMQQQVADIVARTCDELGIPKVDDDGNDLDATARTLILHERYPDHSVWGEEPDDDTDTDGDGTGTGDADGDEDDSALTVEAVQAMSFSDLRAALKARNLNAAGNTEELREKLLKAIE